MLRAFIFLCCFYSLLFSPDCEGERFEKLSIADGLSQNTVMSILQDSQGFLWVGTQDGLNRYDGYEFKIFHHQPNNANSLSDDFINALYQDSNGFIWIGTLTGGLNRFDPKDGSFITYKHQTKNNKSLSHNHVTTIIEDQQGHIWAGTWGGGISVLNPQTGEFRQFKHHSNDASSLSHNLVWSLLRDSQQRIWASTHGGGLNLFQGQSQSFAHFKHQADDPSSISSNKVWGIAEDNFGSLWLGTEGHGVNHFNPNTGKSKHYMTQDHDHKTTNTKTSNTNSMTDNIIRDILVDAQGNTWFASYNGLYKLALGSDEFVRYQSDTNGIDSISTNVIYSLGQSSDGAIWIGLYSGGLNKYNPRLAQFKHLKQDKTNPHSIHGKSVWAIFEDSRGTLWVGTDGGGLNEYNQHAQTFYAHQHYPNDPTSIASNRIWAITEQTVGQQHYLWVGTFGNGLSRFNLDTRQFTHFSHNEQNTNSLSNNRVMSLFVDSNNHLWVGTSMGLNRFEQQSTTFNHFYHDPNNNNSLSHSSILSINEDNNGNIILGTYGGGFTIYDPQTGRFERFINQDYDDNSLANDSVMGSYVDPEGILWLATYGGGLNRYDPDSQTFTHFNESHGLASSSVYGILSDAQGKLWLSTNRGISQFDRHNQTFRNFDVSDGLQSNEFNSGAYFKSAKTGQMYFGGINGFNHFSPEQITRESSRLNVVFSRFSVFNQTITTGMLNFNQQAYSQHSINYARQINLSYRDNNFSLQFTGLNFLNANNVEFAYQLKGWDDEWISVDHKLRRAAYTNIPAGDYQLQVKARHAGGQWQSKQAQVKITITPAPWQTSWAYAAYTLILGSLIGNVVWQRQKRYLALKLAKQRLNIFNLQLEQRVAERTETLSNTIDELQRTQQKLVETEKLASLGGLVAGIAHEINTPLGIAVTASSQIEHMLDQLETKMNEQKLTRTALEQYRDDTKQGMVLLQQNLQRSSRLIQDFKALAIQPAHSQQSWVDIRPLLHQLVQSKQSDLNDHHVELSIECAPQMQIFTHANALVNIFNQLIDNSIIHGFDQQPRGKITIHINQEQQHVTIKYQDNGVGLNAQALRQLFEPFYTTKRHDHCTGLGMLIIHNIIVHQLFGSINCESEPQQGFKAIIKLPINNT